MLPVPIVILGLHLVDGDEQDEALFERSFVLLAGQRCNREEKKEEEKENVEPTRDS
jgi:hypothetical protein